MEIFLYILLGLAVLGVLSTFVVAYVIFINLLLRRGKEAWGRQPSMPDDADYMKLYENGQEWFARHKDAMQEVDIYNEKLHLFGQYFDFGSKNAVIILPGRMEACTYSYHYAEPYSAAGWNVLVIDGRAHGLSDGRLNYLGLREYSDVIAWANFLRDRFGVEKVLLHGICIGSSTALIASASPRCPNHVVGMVADGMFQCFYDSCRNHMLVDHRPIFPFLEEVMILIRLICGIDAKHDGPKKRIRNMHRPILFIHSREDLFSTPDKVQQLFDECPSERKYFTWFEHGWHSKLRLADPERYDEAVRDFINKIESIQEDQNNVL